MKILLATHGHMASGVASSIEILFNGIPENLHFFDAYIDDDKLDDKIVEFLNETDPREVKILISDVYGGSVCQQMTKYMEYENTFVLTGMNLGLVISLLTCSEELDKVTIQKIINDTKEFICLIDQDEMNKNVVEDDIF